MKNQPQPWETLSSVKQDSLEGLSTTARMRTQGTFSSPRWPWRLWNVALHFCIASPWPPCWYMKSGIWSPYGQGKKWLSTGTLWNPGWSFLVPTGTHDLCLPFCTQGNVRRIYSSKEKSHPKWSVLCNTLKIWSVFSMMQHGQRSWDLVVTHVHQIILRRWLNILLSQGPFITVSAAEAEQLSIAPCVLSQILRPY